MEQLVSILIPAFNSERWIKDAINSALAQSWSQKEIIVVDDGSEDRTLELAREFRAECIRVFSQEHLGACAARNLAFSLCRGDYIQWLDADDILAPDKIRRQMEIAQRLPSRRMLLSSAWGRFLHRFDRATFIPTGLWRDLTPVEWLVTKMERNVYMSNATWLVSRELTEAAGPWDTRQLRDQDGEYFCRVLLQSDGVKFIPEAKVYYRVTGPTSVSYVGGSRAKLDSTWRSVQLHISYLRSLEDSPRTRTASVRYLQNNIIQFYPECMDIVQNAKRMAADLGGPLTEPRLPWKYAWIQVLFGWRLAKRARSSLARMRWSVAQFLDAAL